MRVTVVACSAVNVPLFHLLLHAGFIPALACPGFALILLPTIRKQKH
jgi:hypothetical protein